MTRLERRYRLLLRAYPSGYRSDHGDELLDVLLDTAEPGRALPPAREAAALVAGGMRARLTEAARGPAWADGLHLGVVALALVNLAALIPYTAETGLWVALSALGLLAVLRGWVRLALPVLALTGSKSVAITLGQPWLDRTLLPVLPGGPWEGGPALYGNAGPVATATSCALVVLGLLVLAARADPPRRRSWWWLLALPVAAGADPGWGDLAAPGAQTVVRVVLEAALLVAAVYAGHVTRDGRWAVAAAAYFLPATADLGEHLSTASRQEIAHWGLLAVLTLGAAATPFATRRKLVL
ncbi:hypothetical protein [Nonomuraea sp. SBT364]|uniref:hypothetical protein n=1 Tax=Nonomuraea sp. SBT364 TaxID=1580530 RepID=UPI00066C1B38|nr:hypothetical protein [Nonomuraea sp. SBT364]